MHPQPSPSQSSIGVRARARLWRPGMRKAALLGRLWTPRTNGLIERFNGTVLDEFFRLKMRETPYETVEVL